METNCVATVFVAGRLIGATPFIGKNGENVVAKFDQTGVYGVKRRPHYGMGLAAMILVGSPPTSTRRRPCGRSS